MTHWDFAKVQIGGLHHIAADPSGEIWIFALAAKEGDGE